MLFIGDDWAEDHHDIAVMDPDGRTRTRAKLPEGAAGIAKFHKIVPDFHGEDAELSEVPIGIETDRGPAQPLDADLAGGETVVEPPWLLRYSGVSDSPTSVVTGPSAHNTASASSNSTSGRSARLS